MENNLPQTNKQKTVFSGCVARDVETVVRDYQKRILRRTTPIPSDNRVTSRFVKDFEWSSNWAETLASSLETDSRYYNETRRRLPFHHNPDAVLESLRAENRLSSYTFSQLSQQDCNGIVERMKHFCITDMDDSLLDAMYEACNWVIAESITEENCLRELETTQDAIQRAELFMMMGNDVEAYREFANITPEESSNPENALVLVDLVERYESPRAAIRILRKWFLLEIVLHSLPFDLVSDLLTDRKKLEQSPRIRYLQSVLIQSDRMTREEIRNHLLLVMPSDVIILPDPADVDRRLSAFGLSLDGMDLILDENEPVNLCAVLGGVTDQLLHLADLAKCSRNEKLAIKALERSVLGSFVLLNLPETESGENNCFDDLECFMTHRTVSDYLDDMDDILDDLFESNRSSHQHRFLEKQIAALRSLIKRQNTDRMVEESDGMSGMPREYGSH